VNRMTTGQQAYEEVVTHALVTQISLGATGTLALITLDNGLDHTRPSTFGFAGLAELDAALDQVSAAVSAGQIVAVAITGKPYIFAVGADLSGVAGVNDIDTARRFTQTGRRVFARLNDLGVPTFAFVNGAAMGGGLELALHCNYRTLSSGAAALALPETFLGLLPGWGGTWLLPHLIGAAGALKVIIENPAAQNKQLSPKDALALGIADVMFEPADFLERSLAWAASVVRGDTVITRTDHTADAQAWDDAVARVRGGVEFRLHGAAPAPYRALDLVAAARTNSREVGYAAEDSAADLALSEELRASLYAFDLVQKRAKRPAGAPDRSLARPVTKVGIVGAGLMAGQLALLFARRLLVPVVMTDLDQERVDKGLSYVHGEIATLERKGRVSPDAANRLRALVTGTTNRGEFADADFVIEAVFEDLAIKQAVFAELEAVVSETCVLATNTSSLSVTEMSKHLAHPERVVGFHFFNPVAIMPLLEIARTAATDDATLATAFATGKTLKKSCVLVADTPAFVVNRLLTRFLNEVTAAIDEGTPFEVADRALEPLGLPMSPLNLLALVGPAVAHHVSGTMHAAFPERFTVSDNMGRLVSNNIKAIYDWSTGAPIVDPAVRELYVQGNQPSTAEELRTRALEALAQEARLMLDEGVVADARDIDLCMLLGAGWPFHLGGITPYLDRTGVAEKVNGARFLPVGVASLR